MAATDFSRRMIDIHEKIHNAGSGLSPEALKELNETSAILTGRIFDSVVVIFFMFLGLWGAASFVRHWGWIKEDEISVARGIVVPVILGLLFLYTVLLVNA